MTSNTPEKVQSYETAVSTYCDDATPANLAAVSAAYAALPAATRGGAMAATLSAADPACLGDLLAAHTNLPTTSSRVEKRTLTSDESDIIRRIVDDVLAQCQRDAIDGAFDGEDGPDRFLVDATVETIDRVRSYVEKVNIGGGKRTTHNVDPTDVIPAGSTIVCQYKGANVTGVLQDDNSVVVGDDTYESLSAAAIAVTGQDTANGWVHWRHNGQKLAALRSAM